MDDSKTSSTTLDPEKQIVIDVDGKISTFSIDEWRSRRKKPSAAQPDRRDRDRRSGRDRRMSWKVSLLHDVIASVLFVGALHPAIPWYMRTLCLFFGVMEMDTMRRVRDRRQRQRDTVVRKPTG